MSSRLLIALSPDLKKLRDEGYEIQIVSGHLIVKNVPYVKTDRTVAYGALIAPLVIHGEKAGPPKDHTMHFQGETPCDRDGKPLNSILNSSGTMQLANDIVAQHRLSAKPTTGKPTDYYALVTNYTGIIAEHAKRSDPSATALTHRAFDPDDPPSVFAYPDTASTRAGIMAVTQKLEGHIIAIVGLGGTGSYILDFLAKTPVKEIHLFDGDHFVQHNAFRSPGTASSAEVSAIPPLFKVDYFKRKYEALHLGITAHRYYMDAGNVADVLGADFVFMCLDKPAAKKPLVDALVAADKPFIDVGMGVNLEDASLGGILRTTFSAKERREHRNGISFGDIDDVYATNIQIAELNALNAAIAVIRWKKYLGFYQGRNPEYSSLYTIEFNSMTNEDQLEAAP